jgi:hypothetical protein
MPEYALQNMRNAAEWLAEPGAAKEIETRLERHRIDVVAINEEVFHLAGVPLLISPYRSTMGQPEVLPFMNRAKAIDATSVEFIIPINPIDRDRSPLDLGRTDL